MTVYSTTYCGYCRRAEELLRRHGVAFQVIDVTGDRPARARLIERAKGRRTVPVILFGDDLVGGYAELAALAAAGELERRLASATPARGA